MNIDPEDREQVEQLAKVMDDEFARRGWANQSTPDPDVVDAIQAALREFANPTPPPKPEEPTGLGAVVEDAEGERYVNDGLGHWLRLGQGNGFFGHWTYTDVPAVRVLSEGVTA
jgi:hypothetical protein